MARRGTTGALCRLRALAAEKQFRMVQGYKQFPVLLSELAAFVPPKAGIVKRRKAS